MIPKPYTDEEFIDILSLKTEGKNFDFKEKMNWNDSNSKDIKLGIIKDIIAMANTLDGGKIIFGVKDKTFNSLGLSNDDYESFDATTINDLLHTYSDPKFSVSVYKYDINTEDLKGKFVLIDVAEFFDSPIICKKSAHSNKNQNNQILKEGAIYIRTDKAGTEIMPSYFEMKELLTRAVRKNSDELVRNIKNLISGNEVKKVDKKSDDKLNKEIDDADIFFKETIDDELGEYGYWKISIIPKTHNIVFKDQKEIKENIKKSEVELRGWNFPYTDAENNSNINSGIQSYTIWNKSVEAYRVYQSGLFVWKRALWEDMQNIKSKETGAPALSFISAIYSLTEFFIFVSRFYRDKGIESFIVKIELNNIKNRQLVSLQSGVYLLTRYIAGDNSFFYEKQFNITELTVNYREIAKEVVKNIFLLFNWDDPSDSMIDDWQTKLIK